MGSGEDVYFQVKYVLLFIQNNHLFYVLAEPRLTAFLTLALTSPSPFLTLLTLGSPLHAQSLSSHLCSLPPSSSKSLVNLCVGPTTYPSSTE